MKMKPDSAPLYTMPPMNFESFYERIEESECALERGDFITQAELREKV